MSALIWIAGVALLWAPGYVITRALRLFRAEDPVVRFAIEVSLGLSVFPIIFLWTTTLKLRWTVTGMHVVAILIIAAAVVLAMTGWRRLRVAGWPWLAAVGSLVVLAIATRWSQIRDVAFPPWIDGLHHGMIIRLFLHHGSVPATCDPFIPGASLYYHWGYHATAAWLAALLGLTEATDVRALMLQYGQLLNALSVVTMYAGGRILLRSREAGLLTAALALFVSFYPAYYLSWGRYTHLAGTLVLPPLLIALWRLARTPGPWREGAVVVILAAGLILIHVRIAFFAAVFALLLAGVLLVRRRARMVGRWVGAGAVVLLIIVPWVIRLRSDPYARDFVSPARTSRGDDLHQALPLDILWSQHNRDLLAIATSGISGMAGWLGMPAAGRVASAIWWIIVIWVSRFEPRGRTRRFAPWPALALVGAHAAVIALLLYWRPAGIDFTRFASLSSAVMTLFMPLALAGAALITWVMHRLSSRGATLSYAVAVAIALWGSSTMIDIVNPFTVFTDEHDRRAIEWLQKNTPREARFAVDGRPWMMPAWAGIDAGYWIGVATDQSSILPPSLYAFSLPPDRAAKINETVQKWSFPAPGKEAEAWSVIRRAGVTHVYVGSAMAEARRASLIDSGEAMVIYRDGPVAILALR